MANTYTTYSSTGFLSRIVNSFLAVIIGLLLFVASFFVLYINEGRFDTSNLAKTAVDISSQQSNTNSVLNGKLVDTAGVLNSSQPIGDGLFLRPGNYIAVKRTAEMYSWSEKQDSSSKTNLGGSENTQTTYTYQNEWSENPANSANFKVPAGHENPAEAFTDGENRVSSANIGVYNIDVASVDLPSFAALPLTNDNTALNQGVILASNNYLFAGRGNISAPQVGDERISYSVVNSGINAVIFGQLNGNSISPFYDAKEHKLYRIFEGTRDSAIATLHQEYTTLTWILRGVGFLMMWIGLMAMLGTVSVILSFFPFLGSVSRFFVSIITLVVALVLSGATILVSMLFHNPIAIAVVAVVIIGILFVLAQRRRTV